MAGYILTNLSQNCNCLQTNRNICKVLLKNMTCVVFNIVYYNNPQINTF